MRELKFRAWRMHNGKLRRCVCNPFSIMNYAQNHLDEPVMKHSDVNDIRDFMPDADVIEQYTGLKDKNGKEIYEGDIVRIDSMDELRVGYVDLVADQYCIVCGEDKGGNKIVAEFYYYARPEENCEIIGNIHENPELCEKEKE